MPSTRTDLFQRLTELGIATTTVDHPAVNTVAESDGIEIDLPGAHTKNLFLKDDRGKLFLVVAKSTTRVDLKALSRRLGAGRFSFGKPELMLEVLGVSPGAVTAFSVINDTSQRARVIVDDELSGFDSVNCHPLENTATTNIALNDLLRFIRATGHDPVFMSLTSL